MKEKIVACLMVMMMTQLSMKAQNCSSASAGTFSITPSIAKSEVIADREYTLCSGEFLRLNSNGDQNLTADPDPSTTSGIGYMVFSSPPTVSGDTWADVTSGANTPVMNGNVPMIIFGDLLGNSALFQNVENLNEQFPTVWLAPINLNDFNAARAGNVENEGSCVKLSINDVVQVNLLKRLSIRFISRGDGELRLNIRGGLPEWDNGATNYTFEVIENIGTDFNTVNTGTIEFDQDQTITTSTSDIASFIIEVTDQFGCTISSIDNEPTADSVATVDIGCPYTNIGPRYSLPLYFTNISQIVEFSFVISYDPTILRYSSYDTDFPDLNMAVDVVGDELRLNLTGTDVKVTRASPDRFILVQLVFDVIGVPGDVSDLKFERPFSSFMTYTPSDFYRLKLDNCEWVVVPDQNSLFFDYTACSDGNGNVNLSIMDLTGTAPYNLEVVDGSGNQVLNTTINSASDMLDYSFAIGSNPHIITITDQSGAFLSLNLDLEDTQLDFEIDTIQPSCGNANGSIGISSYQGNDTSLFIIRDANGIHSPLSFLAEDFQNQRLENLDTGTYIVEMHSSNGKCIISKEVELLSTEISVNVSIDQNTVNCGDGTMNQVHIQVENFTPTGIDRILAIQIRNAETNAIIRAFNNPLADTIIELPQGSYHIYVKDKTDCETSAFINIWPDDRQFPVIDTILDPICITGSQTPNSGIKLKFDRPYTDLSISVNNITVDPDGPIMPRTVSTDQDSLVSIRSLLSPGLFAGQLIIRISHPDFCERTIVLLLEQKEIDMGVEGITILPYCGQTNPGSIRIDSLRNSDEIHYSINFDNRFLDTLFTPGITFDGLGPLTYIIRLTDTITGCFSEPFMHTVPSGGVQFEIDTEMPPECPNDRTGRFTIRIPSGNTLDSVRVLGGPFNEEIQFLTGPINDGQIVDGLPSGTFEVFAFAMGCMSQELVTLTASRDLPQFNNTMTIVDKQPTCANDNIVIVVDSNDVIENGVPTSEIQYIVASEMGDMINLGDTFSGFLAEGRYAIWLKVGDCLSEPDSFNVTYNMTDLPNIRNPNLIVIDNPNCALDVTEIRLNSDNVNLQGLDSSLVRYVIDDSLRGDELKLDTTYTIMLSEGDHKVWLVVDGCLSVSETFTVMIDNTTLPSIVNDSLIVLDQPNCALDEAMIRLDSTNVDLQNVDPDLIRFVIDDSLSDDLLKLDTTYSLMLEEGDHKIWLHVDGCLSKADTFRIEYDNATLPSIIDPSQIVTTQPMCQGDSTSIRLDSTNVNLQGVDPSMIRFVIDDSANGDQRILDSTYLIPLGPGNHAVWLIHNGCYQEVDFFNVNQGVSPEPMLEQDMYSVNLGADLELNEVSGLPFGLYQWSLNNQVLAQTAVGTFVFQPQVGGTIYLIVQDSQGCTGIDSAILQVFSETNINYPNVFSPNAEQDINRRFKPIINGDEIEGGQVQSFAVFDRFGRQVWSSTNIPISEFRSSNTSFGWDGTHNGQELPPDVYVFVMKVKYQDFADVRLVSGSVTLIR